MNLHDDSLLSGYLDDELDPAQRAQVETALAADPDLAAMLADLTALRRQVDGLARPRAPRDVTANVMARVAGDPRARLQRLVRRHPRWVGAGLAAAAALVLLAVRPPDLAGMGRRPAVAVSPQGGARPVAPRSVAAAVDTATPPVAEAENRPAPAALASALAAAERNAERDRERVRALLDRPGVQRLLVLVDEITPQAIRHVEDALEATPRIEPLQGRLRIGQGITIDPDRPGEAVVYTVVLDDNEVTNLQAQLARRFQPGQIATTVEPADPAVVTQLADAGPLDVREGRAAAPGLFEPPPMPMAHNPGPPDLPPRETLQAEAKSAARTGEPARSPDAPASFPRRVTLVWITTRSSGDTPQPAANPG